MSQFLQSCVANVICFMGGPYMSVLLVCSRKKKKKLCVPLASDMALFNLVFDNIFPCFFAILACSKLTSPFTSKECIHACTFFTTFAAVALKLTPFTLTV